MMQAAPKKVFITAVIIMPPKEEWGPIQAIRAKNDSAYERWMPHVNLIFPFVEYDALAPSADKMREALASIEPFNITLASINHFQHAKSCVMWLEPTPDRINAVKELQAKIEATFPFCDDQGKKSEHGFTPHLTLGQFQKNAIDRSKASIAATWKPINFRVESVFIISRGKDTPFEIAHEVKLGR